MLRMFSTVGMKTPETAPSFAFLAGAAPESMAAGLSLRASGGMLAEARAAVWRGDVFIKPAPVVV